VATTTNGTKAKTVERNVTEQVTQYQSEEERIIDLLDELGGRRVKQDEILREGNRFIIPETMDIPDAIQFLGEYEESQEAYTSFSRRFNYKPWDGAFAVQGALRKLLGTAGIGKPTWGFFTKHPPEQRTIATGVGQVEQVPWGALHIPMFGDSATLYLGSYKHKEYGLIFQVNAEVPKRYKTHIEALFKLIERELKDSSIYKGKPIDGQEEPAFLDLTGVERDRVIFSEDVESQLEANVWSLLKYTDEMRKQKLPLKRSVLLEGPYGTGKTLGLFLTGQIAVANGWTFLYCRPGKDDLHEVMQTARLYQPAVVCFEDVDTISSKGEEDHVSKLLDLFDGITAKGTELVVVMTTNHPERIHKGMVRPGRLDSVIHIGALDKQGIMRMIHAVVPEEILGAGLDFDAIAESMKDYLPAFVKEAIDRTMRYAIARSGGTTTELTTEDFVLAANGLRDQLRLMTEAGEGTKADPLGRELERIFRGVVQGTGVIQEGDEEPFAKLQPVT
jgi:transitional endoplasmic reticulum ATPase